MEEFVRIASIEDEVQARLLETMLSERDIPHLLRSHRDSSYDGLFQSQTFWGHIEAPAAHREEILALIAALDDQGESANPDQQETGK